VDTVVSGTIGGDWWLFGSSFFFVAFGYMFIAAIGRLLFIAAIGWFRPAPKWRTAKRSGTGRVTTSKLAPVQHVTDIVRGLVISAGLLMIALLMVVTWLSHSFCARPQGIFIHATFFDEGKIYAWTDVSKITAYCSGRSNSKLNFDADMNDGQTIPLGEHQQEKLIRNYRAVSDALRDVPFIYDNSRISKCRSSSLRDLLATRPGAHVDEPH
jgi:hypothetical protein